jgi:hypothetical protein
MEPPVINKADLEEARLFDGQVMLRWKAPRELAVKIMTAQEYHEMLRDFDNAISIVEQEYPECDDRHKLATAMRKRWFP